MIFGKIGSGEKTISERRDSTAKKKFDGEISTAKKKNFERLNSTAKKKF